MRICIDATPIGIKTTDKGGVYRYISSLIEALSIVDQKSCYTLFFNFFRKENLPAFNDAVRRLRVGSNFKIRLSRFPPRLRQAIDPPVELLAGRFDVFHGCFDHLPATFGGRRVVTIHDVRYLEDIEDGPEQQWIELLERVAPQPEVYISDCLSRNGLFNHLRSTVRKTVDRADTVITVSEFCKGRIVELLNIPEERVKVIHHGVDSRFRPVPADHIKPVLIKYGIKGPYILYTGKCDPLKNLSRLLEAFERVARYFKGLTLVIAGPVNWYYHVLLEEARRLGIKDMVVFTGFVKEEDIVPLYSGASVFVMPSLYEGFGMPVVEAMACGVPVVTSDVCSIPEIAGDGALFIDPNSSEGLADGIVRSLSDAVLRKELIEKGMERARLFTWERTARETLRVYYDG